MHERTDTPTKTPKKAPSVKVHPTGDVTAVAVINPDLAVSADAEGNLLSWPRGAETAQASRKVRPGPVTVAGAGAFAVARDGSAAFTAVDAHTLIQKARLPHKGASHVVSGSTPDLVITAGGKTLKAWKMEGWASTAEVVGPGSTIVRLEATPSKAVVLATDEKSVGLFHATPDLRPISRRAFADVDRIDDARIDPSGELVALSFVDRQGHPRVRLWRAGSVDALTLDIEAQSPWFVAGGVLVRAGDTLVLFDYDGKERTRTQVSDILDLPDARVIAADERRLAVTGGGRLIIYEVAAGQVIQRHGIDARFVQVVFTGPELVCATDAGHVLWLKSEMSA